MQEIAQAADVGTEESDQPGSGDGTAEGDTEYERLVEDDAAASPAPTTLGRVTWRHALPSRRPRDGGDHPLRWRHWPVSAWAASSVTVSHVLSMA